MHCYNRLLYCAMYKNREAKLRRYTILQIRSEILSRLDGVKVRGVLLFLLLLALSVILSGVIYSNKVRDVSRTSVDLLEQIQDQNINAFESDLSRLFTELYRVKLSLLGHGLLDPDSELDRQQLEQFLLGKVSNIPFVSQVRWIDENGFERARLDRLKGDEAKFISAAELQDKSARYYFQEAVHAEPENIYVSEIDLNVEKGRVVTPFEPTIRMSISTGKGDGLLPGVIVVNFDLGKLFEKIYSSVEDGQVFQLVKSDGAWVINSENPEVAWASLLGVSKAGIRQLLTAELVAGRIHDEEALNGFVKLSLPASDAENISYYVRSYLDDDYLRQIKIESVYTTLPLLCMLLIIAAIWTYVSVRYELSLKTLSAELSKQLEIAKQANSYKSQFLANMSHEIRTPLSAIIGLLGVVRRNPDSRILTKNLPLVEESAKNLLVLINDILDLSKVESGKLKLDIHPFNLGQVADKTIALFSREADIKDIEFQSSVDPRLSKLSFSGDALRIGQVLNNLVGNAIKFTRHGSVKLVVQLLSQSESHGLISVRVEDTGIGIESTNLSRLFESFEQADFSTTKAYGGSGLGLTISRHFLSMMDAELKVVSEPGVGSVFSFQLNLPISLVAVEKYSPSVSDVPHRILLLESNEEISRSIYEMLDFWGGQVDVAKTETEALNLFKNSISSSEPIRLILLSWDIVGAQFKKFRDDINVLCQEENILIPPKLLMMSELQRGEAPFDYCSHNEIAILQKPVTISRFLDALNTIGLISLVSEDNEQDELEDLQLVLQERLKTSTAPRILLAEDNTYNQVLIEELFSSFGLALDIVSNGEQAVMAVTSKHYDLIFMDIQMPVMDGLTASVEIRKTFPKEMLPIIAISAASFPSDINQAIIAGMNFHLTKPIDVSLLLKAIIKYWKASSAAYSSMERQVKSSLAVIPDPVTPEQIAINTIFSSDSFSPQGSILDLIDEFAYLRVAKAFVEGMAEELLHWQEGTVASAAQRRALLHKLLGTVGSLGAHLLLKYIQAAWHEVEETGDADMKRVLDELGRVVAILRENIPS